MLQLVFMVEEMSMKVTLENIFKKMSFKKMCPPIIIPHEGKNDLKKSIPRKLIAWPDNSHTQYKFIIMQDQDNANCIIIKTELQNLCKNGKRSDSVIRIVCQNLESWLLGDLAAVEKVMSRNIRNKNSAKYRNPDKLGNPTEEIEKLFNGSYAKVGHARKISAEMNLDINKSNSFKVFMKTLRAFC